MDSLKINTGLVRLKIERDGEEGVISFNPSDVGFADRVYKLLADFNNKEKEYRAQLSSIDNSDSGGAIALLKDLCLYMRGQIDFCFGYGTSQTVFGDALEVGMFEQFFDGITPYIQRARQEKLKKYAPEQQGNVMR